MSDDLSHAADEYGFCLHCGSEQGPSRKAGQECWHCERRYDELALDDAPEVEQ